MVFVRKSLLVAPVSIALFAFPPVMSSHADRAAATVAGTTFVVPSSIDATGTRDVTDELNLWLATGTTDGAPGVPNRIVLKGTFRVEYGLTIGNSGPSTYRPNLPAYTRNHVLLDLTNATLVQRDATPYSSVNGVVTERRKRWGVPLIKILGGQDIEVLGGLLTSTNNLGVYSPRREAWHGVLIVGTDGARLVDLHVAGVWGDFVYIIPRRGILAHNVLISGGKYERNGRQGITMNGVDGLEIARVEFRNVEHILFDHEPTPHGGLTNVNIHDCFGNTGGSGFVSFRPLQFTPLHDISIRNHRLVSGHFNISVATNGVQRANISITGNATNATTPFSQDEPLIRIGGSVAGFNGVDVTNNYDIGNATNPAVSVGTASTRVVTTPNAFIGFAQNNE
jgi:hypothetical protein